MIKQLNTTKLAASTCHKAINKPNHVQHKNNADFSFFVLAMSPLRNNYTIL